MKKEQTSLAGESRRDFIKKTATVGAAVAATGILKTPVYGQNTAPSTGKVIGANDRINVAVVGVGFGIGINHFKGIQEKAGDNNVVVAAGCDLFKARRDWMTGNHEFPYAKKLESPLKEADVYTEYRKLLERKDIDAVVVATHDVWHANIACDAMESGKHVYCEKPMTRYLDEAFRVYDTVKKTGKILQVGSQGCSAAGWHKAAELIKGGKIGQLVWSQGYYCRNNPKGEWNYDIDKLVSPETLDFNTWLGQVKNKRPDIKTNRDLAADHFHRWRKYYPYCGGLLGDLVPHRLHPLMLASGNPEFPRRVISIGSKNVLTDKKTPGTPIRDVPEHVTLTAEFPSGYLLTVTASTVNAKSPGFVIYGHKATLNIADQGQSLDLLPERWASEDVEPEQHKGLQPEDIRVHEKNWFDCIRANKQPNAGIELAIRVQTVISLAEQSERMNMACLFDEKTRKVTDGNGKEVPALTYGTLELS
jgi:predicted dehydrogenase